jgi:hypothetical protein
MNGKALAGCGGFVVGWGLLWAAILIIRATHRSGEMIVRVGSFNILKWRVEIATF